MCKDSDNLLIDKASQAFFSFYTLKKFIPQHIVRQRGFDMHRLMGHRMLEIDAAGHERDAAVGVGTSCTVLQVAPDGETDFGELAANLVMAPGLEVDLEQEIAIALGEHTVIEFGAFGVGHLAVVSVGLVLLLIALEPMHQRCLRRALIAFDDGPVGLVNGQK